MGLSGPGQWCNSFDKDNPAVWTYLPSRDLGSRIIFMYVTLGLSVVFATGSCTRASLAPRPRAPRTCRTHVAHKTKRHA